MGSEKVGLMYEIPSFPSRFREYCNPSSRQATLLQGKV